MSVCAHIVHLSGPWSARGDDLQGVIVRHACQDLRHRSRGIDDFIATFEAEYGEITDEEMDVAYRASKTRAIVVRGGQVVSDGHSGVA
jgi:hypothetical protein